MNSGFWIFATAVLLLVVLHPGFRRFASWAGIVAAVIAVIGFGTWVYTERAHNKPKPVDISGMPVPPDCPPGDSSDNCWSAVAGGSNNSDQPGVNIGRQDPNDPDRVVAIDGCPVDAAGNVHCRTAATDAAPRVVCPSTSQRTPDNQCVDIDTQLPVTPVSVENRAPWEEYRKVHCPAHTEWAKDAAGNESCYDPNDSDQLLTHLAECGSGAAMKAADHHGHKCSPLDSLPSPPKHK